MNMEGERFEMAWENGSRPRIEDYLTRVPEPKQPGLLRHLLLIELERRLGLREKPTVEEYQARFPKDAELIKAVFREAVLLRPLANSPKQDGPMPGSEPSPSQVQGRADGELPSTLERAGSICNFDPKATGPSISKPGNTPGVPLRYRALRPHAKGGLGEIYVAEDLELHREVALKELQERFEGDPQSRARF